MSEKKFNVLTIVKYLILIIIVGILVSVIIQLSINKNKTPNFWGYKMYVVLTGSMEPEIYIGDIVLIKENEVIARGDVVAYRDNRTIIVHRIVGVEIKDNDVFLITKGDNNRSNDIFPVGVEKVEGKCIGIIRYLGYIFIFLYKYWILVGIGIVIFIIVRLLIQTIKNKRAD